MTTPDVLVGDDPRLRVPPRLVMRGEDLSYLRDMRKALQRHNGLGIWAGQLGVPRRAILVKPLRAGEGTVMLNPEVLLRTEHVTDAQPEASLSYPGVDPVVIRSHYVKVMYDTPDWTSRVVELTGMGARIVQHLVDLMAGKCPVAAAWHRQNRSKDQTI